MRATAATTSARSAGPDSDANPDREQVKTIEKTGHGYRCLVHYHGWSTRSGPLGASNVALMSVGSDDIWIDDEELDQRDRIQRAAKNGKIEACQP